MMHFVIVWVFIIALGLCTQPSLGDQPFVIALESNGQLSWDNDPTNARYQVQWAPSLTGTWRSSWAELSDISSTSALINVDVPMFYRVSKNTNLVVALERIAIPSDGSTVMSSITLLHSHTYHIVVNGIFRFNTTDPNYGEFADAQLYEDVFRRFSTRTDWVGFDGVQVAAYLLNPDSHSYTYLYTGKNSKVQLRIFDTYYPDNDGVLYATIYSSSEIPAANYPIMNIAGTFNDWNTSNDVMMLTSNNTWQTTKYLTNSYIEFKYLANQAWGGPDWGDNNQTNYAVPISEWCEALGSNILVTNMSVGNYRFTFNDESLQYWVDLVP